MPTLFHYHFDGTDNSTTIVDSSLYATPPFVVNGAAKLKTTTPTTPWAGTASLYLDGSAGTYIRVAADTSSLYWLPGDFWIETRIKTSSGNLGAIFDRGYASGGYSWRMTAAGKLQFVTGATQIAISTSSINNGAWRHVAVGRSGTTVYLFVDGVMEASGTWSGVDRTNLHPVIGYSLSGGTALLTANLDEMLLIDGFCKTTTTFTPATAPYVMPVISGTVLDASGNAMSTGTIRLHTRGSGKVAGSVTPAAGAFSITADFDYPEPWYAVALDPDGGGDPNALIIDRIYSP